MGLINRYIVRNHVAPFIFGVSTVVFLFLMQFVMKQLGNILGKGLDTLLILELVALNLPWMLILAVPMGVLFSTLMAFGNMTSNHEITIIKASGGSLLKMMRPIVLLGVLLTGVMFWFNDVVLPESNHRAKTLLMDIKRLKPTFAIDQGQFSTGLDDYTILSRRVDSSGILYGVTIYDKSNYKESNIITADTGTVKFIPEIGKINVNLYQGEIHQSVKKEVSDYKIIHFKEYVISIRADGFNYEETDEDMVSRGDRERTISNMQTIVDQALANADSIKVRINKDIETHYNYLVFGVRDDTRHKEIENTPQLHSLNDISTIEIAPKDTVPILAAAQILTNAEQNLSFFNTTISSDIIRINDFESRAEQYYVEIHKKYSIPFACLIFVFVGCPLGILTRGGNFGVSALISLGFYIFYWACLIGGEKLADRGYLPAGLSMWLGNYIIGIIGILLTLKANSEMLTIFNFKKIFKKLNPSKTA